MPVYAYRALTAAGDACAGVVDADSQQAAWQALRSRGVYPTTLEEDVAAAASRERAIPAAELAAVTRQLALLAGAGVPLSEALEAAAETTTHPRLVRALTRVRAGVRAGRPLADALADAPGVSPALPRAGTGERGRRRARPRARAARGLPRAYRRATRAPARHAHLSRGDGGGGDARPSSSCSAGCCPRWPVSSPRPGRRCRSRRGCSCWRRARSRRRPGGSGCWFWSVAGSDCARGSPHPPVARAPTRWVLRLPLVGRAAGAAALARVAHTLSTLLAGGVRLEVALDLAAAAAGNAPRRRRAGGGARGRPARGSRSRPRCAQAASFPAPLLRLIATGERSGGLADALAHAADSLDAEVERDVATATALVEPALVLVMGAAVLVLVLVGPRSRSCSFDPLAAS